MPTPLAAALLTAVLAASAGCRTRPAAPAPPPEMLGATAAPAASAAAAQAAPTLSLEEAAYLRKHVEELVDSFQTKQAERLAGALEPYELVEELVPRTAASGQPAVDPIESHFNAGEELFEFEFTPALGLGDAMGGKAPNMHRVHRGAHGGPDTTSCRSCHHRGGDDGAGEYPEAAFTAGDGSDVYRANERNPPSLLGGGALQILAQEITTGLMEHYKARASAKIAYSRELTYQGTNFGTVRILPGGALDTSRVTAIDPDLVVRPFGWKGTHSQLRRFAEEAFQLHHGMQSQVLVERRQVFGPMPRGSSPATQALFAALGDGPPRDPDGDGIYAELGDLHLTAISVYLTLLPLPEIAPPRTPDLLQAWHDGERAFEEAKCATCHKPFWSLMSPVWRERSELMGGGALVLDLRKDIRNGPPLRSADTARGGYPLYVFSDLRRHDMGPELADSPSSSPSPLSSPPPPPRALAELAREIPPAYFMTRPLWGVADTAPYLHDGRAGTLHEAILWHGGEAQASRDAYRRLPASRQRALQVFLLSLTRPALPEVVP